MPTIDATDFGQAISSALDDIAEFVSTPEFTGLMQEFSRVPSERRNHFVRRVIINPDELARRGIRVPDDMTVQRSAFEDGRPTLFCVTKYLPQFGAAKKKVTVTFDEGWEKSLLAGTTEQDLEGDLCFYEPV
jgi:hypothetical protein